MLDIKFKQSMQIFDKISISLKFNKDKDKDLIDETKNNIPKEPSIITPSKSLPNKLVIKKIIPEYRLFFLEKLKNISYLSQNDREKLDEKVYEYSIEFASANNIKINSDAFARIYKNKSYHIYVNLTDKEDDKLNYINNKYLHEKIKENIISLENIVKMQPREMYPERWKFYNEKEDAEVRAITQGDMSLQISELFQCSRCKQKKCSYVEKQVRCADEPQTIYITCLNCGKKWIQ